MKNYAKRRRDLIIQLCAAKNLLSEPAPSWEPKAHDRFRALYHKAAMELAALEVEKEQKALDRARRNFEARMSAKN